jgi:hypothetical protein
MNEMLNGMRSLTSCDVKSSRTCLCHLSKHELFLTIHLFFLPSPLRLELETFTDDNLAVFFHFSAPQSRSLSLWLHYVLFLMWWLFFSSPTDLPPTKRRRGLAGSIVSTAWSAALIGTAVGLTVYRL